LQLSIRHVLYLQIFNTYNRVVLADCGSGLMKIVFPHVGNPGMELVDLRFCFFPIGAEFLLTCHCPLIPGKSLLVLFEAVVRLKYGAV